MAHTPSVYDIEGSPRAHTSSHHSPPRSRLTFDGKYSSIVERISSRYYREQAPTFEEISLSEDALLLSMSNEKVGLVKEYSFEEFCVKHFKPRTSWGVKVPITEALTFSASLIAQPLMRLDQDLKKIARQTFKNICSYMKVRNSSKNSLHHIFKVLRAGVQSPLEVRDEIFCQLVKQTNNNPSKSAIKAWKLFGICAGVFAPSAHLRLPLLNHLITIVENEEEVVAQRARYCANRIEKHFLNDKRLVLPEIQEIKHMKHMKPMPVNVYFMTGARVVILVESYDTANAIKRRLLQKIKMPTPKMPHFGLYEICQKSNAFEERFVWDCELIMDILTHWNTFPEDNLLRLVLRRRICTPINESEKDLVSFTYAQTSFDVLSGKLQLDKETFIKLAGYMLQIDLGEFKETELISLDEVLSENAKFLMTYRDWVQALKTTHSKLSGQSKHSSRFSYIQTLFDFPLFLCEHFSVKLLEVKGTNRLSLSKMMWLSINYSGFHLCELDFTLIYQVFPFSDVISWGVASDRFVLVALYLSDQVEIHLETKMGVVIQHLAEGYANYIAGRSAGGGSVQEKWIRKEGLTRTFVTVFPRLTKEMFK